VNGNIGAELDSSRAALWISLLKMKSCLKAILPTAGILLAAALLPATFVAANQSNLRPGGSGPAPAPSETLFRQKCSKCHGVDGRGDTSLGRIFNPPDFTDAGWWAKHSNTRELVNTIARGRKNMPAFGKKLTRSQISSLATYVQRFKT